MAKNNSMKRYVRLSNDPQITLATLANVTALGQDGQLTLAQDVRISSIDIRAAIDGLTVGQGPLVMVLADEGYSVTEVKEFIEAQPASENDIPSIEHSRRKIRYLGSFSGATANEILTNDRGGQKHKVRLNWPVAAGRTMPQILAYNDSGALLTTGALIRANCIYHCKWQ